MSDQCKLHDLTTVHVAREMERHRDGDPLADPAFQRGVSRVSSAADRTAAANRLRPAGAGPDRFRRFTASILLAAVGLTTSAAAAKRIRDRPNAPEHPVASAFPVDARCPIQHGTFGSSVVTGGLVVCLVDSEIAGKWELFSVPAAGGAPVRISPALGADRDVIRFLVSADGARVAFTCDRDRWTQYELFAVPATGGAPTKISGAIATDHDVDDFVWSGRGDQVVFRYGRNATGVWNLYAVPAAGGSRVQLNAPPVENGAVMAGFHVDLGVARYSCDCESDEVVLSYSAPLPKTIFGDGFESGTAGWWR
jgi:hypothetical protein